MSKRKSVMVDLETMGTTPDTVVLTLGAVRFDPYADDRVKEDRENEKLYLRFVLETQDARSISEDTLKWWADQSDEARAEAFDDGDDRIDLEDGLRQFTRFFKGATKIWSHGATFDIVILENAYIEHDLGKPWKFWNARDTRTMFDLGHDPEMPKEGLHHALADSMRQVIGVQNVYRKLGLKE